MNAILSRLAWLTLFILASSVTPAATAQAPDGAGGVRSQLGPLFNPVSENVCP